MKIYTKQGDGGNTYLIGGKKVRKDDPLIDALGAVDELNAALGGAVSLLENEPAAGELMEVQKLLIVLGTDLAASPGRRAPSPVPRILPIHIAWVEEKIDALETVLPPLKSFVLPGGSPAGCALHLARAICRRTERRVVSLLKKKRASKDALIFLNRLSDYLFITARTINRRTGKTEPPWT